MSIEKIKQLREMTGAGFADVKKALVATDYDIDAAVKWLRENGIAKAAKKSGRIAAEGIVVLEANDSNALVLELNSETDFVSSNEKFIEGSQKIAKAILDSSVISKDLDAALMINVDGQTIEQIVTDLTAVIGEKITLRRFEKFDLNNDSKAATYKHSNSKIGVVVVGDGIDADLLRDLSMHIAAMNPQFISLDDIDAAYKNEVTESITAEYSKTYAGKPENVLKNIINGAVNKQLAENALIEQSFVKDPSKKVKDLLKGGSITAIVRYEVGEGIEKKEDDFAAEVARQASGK